MPTINLEGAFALLSHVGEYTKEAVENGPFFFGVFLVLVAVGLIILNKNRFITGFFAIFGVSFMAVASVIYSGVVEPIHAYLMRIDNLPKDHLVVLASDSAPRLYRHNRNYDAERESYYIDLVAISPERLNKGHPFSFIVKESTKLKNSDGEEFKRYVKHTVSIPFNGESKSAYVLERLGSDEEGGLGGYKLAKHTTPDIQISNSSFFEYSFFPVVQAGNSKVQVTQPQAESYQPETKRISAKEENIVNTEVIYYQRPSDKEKVTSALSKLGISYGIKSSNISNPINSIWIGKEVSSEIVEKIGKYLLEEDVDLRYFGNFMYRNTKTNLVQIGYSRHKANNMPVSLADIEAFVEELQAEQKNALIHKERQKQVNQEYEKAVQQLQQRY